MNPARVDAARRPPWPPAASGALPLHGRHRASRSGAPRAGPAGGPAARHTRRQSFRLSLVAEVLDQDLADLGETAPAAVGEELLARGRDRRVGPFLVAAAPVEPGGPVVVQPDPERHPAVAAVVEQPFGGAQQCGTDAAVAVAVAYLQVLQQGRSEEHTSELQSRE